MALNTVDFPAPFGPRIATTSPASTLSDTASTARAPPYLTVMSLTSRINAATPAKVYLKNLVISADVFRRAFRKLRTIV